MVLALKILKVLPTNNFFLLIILWKLLRRPCWFFGFRGNPLLSFNFSSHILEWLKLDFYVNPPPHKHTHKKGGDAKAHYVYKIRAMKLKDCCPKFLNSSLFFMTKKKKGKTSKYQFFIKPFWEKSQRDFFKCHSHALTSANQKVSSDLFI